MASELLPGVICMSEDHQFTVTGSGKQVTQVAVGSDHLHLIRSDLIFTLQYAINRAGCSAAICTPIVSIRCHWKPL